MDSFLLKHSFIDSVVIIYMFYNDCFKFSNEANIRSSTLNQLHLLGCQGEVLFKLSTNQIYA
jgi:hypothetical protein